MVFSTALSALVRTTGMLATFLKDNALAGDCLLKYTVIERMSRSPMVLYRKDSPLVMMCNDSSSLQVRMFDRKILLRKKLSVEQVSRRIQFGSMTSLSDLS
eukprot:CAMPEP_0197828114 /NCGR_PEP_ID=MMETSP1437-20131217/4757_1 /TAXON_ID=49252 ORGANISM="Eucampia antarctica, Strain CCMP1452" /NCGR_SAMPLE_ID=MMETSP1437 /ASSEMBLY_ACC=CAM_ASM_001096 /LENGTH=100 /DNA_ID=CAMNT_0043429223 /DNA_START=78 /DNA_END=380 /DNA_ORIENTATION=-